MAWLAAYIHAKGLLAGIYTDAGATGCGGGTQGSYGHYQQDIDTFAAWGFDAVKVDFCGGGLARMAPWVQYGQIARAIAADTPYRPMIFNICNPLEPGHDYSGTWPTFQYSAFNTWSYAPRIATSWRVSYDIGYPHAVPFGKVLHNLDAAAAHPQAAGNGHFDDPDYIVPNAGMSPNEAQAQFTMWALLTAPMMLSVDPAVLSPLTLKMITNREAIAINQDPSGVQGVKVGSSGGAEIWVKPLANGQKAVALLNRRTSPATASFNAATVGLPSARRLGVRDIWAGRSTLVTSAMTVRVPAHGAVLLRVGAV